MSEVVEFACPHCQRVSRVSAQLAGKQARCPGCRKVFEIPKPTSAKPGKGEKKPEAQPREKKPAPAAPDEEGTLPTPTPTATATAKPASPGVLVLLRQLPPLLLVGLVVAAVLPGAGAIPCAIYALRSEPGSLAKKWGRIGLGIAVFATLLHFTLLRAQPPANDRARPQATPRRIGPGGG